MNRAHFGIQYAGPDMWLNPEGNIGSRMCAAIFETSEEAQRFLDTRRLRRGFRQSLNVAPIAVADIFTMAATAQDYAAKGDPFWATRATVLADLLPVGMAAR